jgi:chromosome segregation ATPase
MQLAAQESLQHERDIRDLQHQLEQVRLDRDEFSRAAETEKALVDDLRSQLDEARRDLDLVKGGEDAVNEALRREREKARNLQAVLQDFQAGWSSLAGSRILFTLISQGPRTTPGRQGL